MVGLPILTEKGEGAMIISESAVRHSGGCVKQRFLYIKLHQERGQDRDGAVSVHIIGSYRSRQGVQRQKKVKTA